MLATSFLGPGLVRMYAFGRGQRFVEVGWLFWKVMSIKGCVAEELAIVVGLNFHSKESSRWRTAMERGVRSS